MKNITKGELMDFWVKYAYDKRGVWEARSPIL